MDIPAQCLKVILYLSKYGSITQYQANWLGVERLAARIYDLKKMGYDISKTMIEVINADGSRSHVAQYTINQGGINA